MSAGAGADRFVARRSLRLDDLHRLRVAAGQCDPMPHLFRAVEQVSAETIGHRLLTVMRFDAERFEVERLYSSLPADYPVGGRKPKARTAWGEQVLVGMRVFRVNTPEEIGEAFDDHAQLASLGIGAILNIPLCFDGRCIGTLNLCHQAHWFTAQDERDGLLLGAFLIPALLRSGSPG
jgi:hypothetical protein